MQLTDPLRPAFISGRPKLLLDGSAVPHLSIMPRTLTEVEIIVLLRDADAQHSFTYGQYTHVCAVSQVEPILQAYYLDPEALLRALFLWEPKRVAAPVRAPAPVRRAMSPDAQAELASQLDLI